MTRGTIDRGTLAGMNLRELQELYLQVVGERTRCPNMTYLIRKILAAADANGLNACACGMTSCGNHDEDNAPEGVTGGTQMLEDETMETSAAVTTDAVAMANDDAATHEETVSQAAVETTEDALHVQENCGAPTEAVAGCGDAPPRLSKLSLEELRARYAQVFGRETNSESKAYLVWKLRAAARGVMPAAARAPKTTEDFKVIPCRIPSAELEGMDSFWKAHGFKSRTQFILQVIKDRMAAGNGAEG